MTKNEVYENIEKQLLIAMNAIDISVYLMQMHYKENEKEIDKMYKVKVKIEVMLNSKYDFCARKNENALVDNFDLNVVDELIKFEEDNPEINE